MIHEGMHEQAFRAAEGVFLAGWSDLGWLTLIPLTIILWNYFHYLLLLLQSCSFLISLQCVILAKNPDTYDICLRRLLGGISHQSGLQSMNSISWIICSPRANLAMFTLQVLVPDPRSMDYRWSLQVSSIYASTGNMGNAMGLVPTQVHCWSTSSPFHRPSLIT
jgi:hypothetical protein